MELREAKEVIQLFNAKLCLSKFNQSLSKPSAEKKYKYSYTVIINRYLNKNLYPKP